MPPKSWFSGTSAASVASKSSVLDDGPALPGMGSSPAAAAAPAAATTQSRGSAARAPQAQEGSYRPANAWTGKPDSRAEAAAVVLTEAPALAPVPADPKPKLLAPAPRPVVDKPKPKPKQGAAPVAATPAAAPGAPAGDATATAPAAGAGGRGRGRAAPAAATPAAASGAPAAGDAGDAAGAPAAGAEGRGRGRGRGAPVEHTNKPLPYLEVVPKRDPAVDILATEAPRASLQQAEVTAVSKKLSQILRHGALEQGFPITLNGYVPLDALLGHGKFKQVTRAVIAKCTLENGKQRFQMAYGKDGAVYIRANQGHSMDGITVDMHRITDPAEIPVAVHGTKVEIWPTILANGLNRMNRQHVHMALDVPGSDKVVSGARATSTCIIYVDVKQLVTDGVEVLLSANGVVLSPGIDGVIPPKYLIRAVESRKNVDMWRRPAQ